jgi:AcrR family transcriptional regulator
MPKRAAATRSRLAPSRPEAIDAFLDAAERLLVEEGYAAITTRRLAEATGANHGLVHYYFGSMEELFVRVLERFTDRLVDRQKQMYAADEPFVEKWRAAMRYLDEDLESGYQKIWLELQALAWNRSALQARVALVNKRWRAVLTEAFSAALRGYRLEAKTFPVEAVVSLVMTFNQGIILERHSGMSAGHAPLLEQIDRWLLALEKRKRSRKGGGR